MRGRRARAAGAAARGERNHQQAGHEAAADRVHQRTPGAFARRFASIPKFVSFTSTVTSVDAPCASETTIVHTPYSSPEMTVNVAAPATGVAVVDASSATNIPLGAGAGGGEPAAQLMLALNGAVLPVSVTVNGALVGAVASNISVAGETAGAGVGEGLADGLAAGLGRAEAAGLGLAAELEVGAALGLAAELVVGAALGLADANVDSSTSAYTSGDPGAMLVAEPLASGNVTVVPLTVPGPIPGSANVVEPSATAR